MREINLPIPNTYSLTPTIDTNRRSEWIEQQDGTYLVPLGNIVSPEKASEIEMARLNGGKILYATTSVERLVDKILIEYFMGPFQEHDEKRVLFENDVIQSSSFSYSFKKALIKRILDTHKLLKGDHKNKLNKYLKDIMIWRNAFAHGDIEYNDPKGCYIEYYSGEKKKLILSDEYWDKVEHTFSGCNSLLLELTEKLQSLFRPTN
ncbi:MAG: hypothetical protein OQK73_00270 [Gammaproteobacteria bacterium]|nr:hypothetical protein [Gammaproteobacteria bacterium]